MKKQVLIIDDEPNLTKVLSALLREDGYDTVIAEDGKAGVDAARGEPFDLVISDLKMPEMDGIEVLSVLSREQPEVPVIMISAHGTVPDAVNAMKLGAFDFITKPFEKEQMLEIVSKAVKEGEARRAQLQVLSATEPEELFELVGASPEMKEIFRQVRTVAASDATVLILGETGTGKELLAKCLHRLSPRAAGPFIAVSCAALPPTLLESELFGHQKGAFTGAVENRHGRFELSQGGTLFLDEIGEIPLSVQVKLLRALEEKKIERLGGIKTIELDTRIVCATHRDLKKAVQEGSFREDLYYRINVVPLKVPPLRARRADIIPLANTFIARFSKNLGRTTPTISNEAASIMENYDFPGNVRELENALERALIFLTGDVILPRHLPPEFTGLSPEPEEEEGAADLKESVEQSRARLEKRLILDALEKTGGNRTKAAVLLGLSRRGLQFKLKRYGIGQDDTI